MKQLYFQILKFLIKIPSPSGSEGELAEYIANNYSQNGWVAKQDDVHNILFCPKGDDKTEELPLLYAHLDTHPNGEGNNHLLSKDDIICLDEYGQVSKKYIIQMGFDDKAGVAAILYLMQHTKLKFRALFVVQEETVVEKNGSVLPTKYNRVGGGGIEYAIQNIQNEEFCGVFSKSKYVLSLDRMNGRDIIAAYGGNGRRERIDLCSKEFKQRFTNCSIESNYPMEEANSDNVADVYNIRRAFPELDCLNLSIGYYGEHKNCEQLQIDETLGVINVVQKLIENY